MSHQVACRITRVKQLTSSVRQLILEVPETELSKVQFLPGQWVDFWPSGFNHPGGFSISSSPKMMPKIELAVKKSEHPVVKWIHSEQCTKNQIVQIAIGGDWIFETQNSAKTLLLVAGGVGITPILSMLRHLVDTKDFVGTTQVDTKKFEFSKIRLIYSARNWEDILYKQEVLDCMNKLEQLSVSILLTDPSGVKLPDTSRVQFHHARLNPSMLEEFDKEETVAYLCGPPEMSDQINSSMHRATIKYEKWW